jgi:parallel beta-helix repeat protein
MEGSGVDPHIEGNTIDATNGNGAISTWGGARPTIVGNTIRHDNVAISVRAGYITTDSGSRPTVIDNTIESGKFGIVVPSGQGAHIEGNRFDGTGTAISLSSTDAMVKDNLIRVEGLGIMVSSGSPTIDGNDVSGARVGVAIGRDSSPRLSSNTICGNEAKLVLNDGAIPEVDATNEICEDQPAS